MKFTKMHGIGNDYIYVNCFEETVSEPEKTAIVLSDVRKGIGSDGLVMIMPSDVADFRMRMFNIDGSEGKMCGNATRCIGKYVYEKGLTDKKEITLETLSGIKHLTLSVNSDNKVELVKVDMGKAILEPEKIPVDYKGEKFINVPVEVNGDSYNLTCVSMGNPHAVLFTENIAALELEKTGPYFENHVLFPERINTEFIEVIDNHTLNMRVWERGSGETFACGTGACASAVAAVLNGYCNYDDEILIHLRGGDLYITYKSDGTVIMKGSADFICDGTVDDKYINNMKEGL